MKVMSEGFARVTEIKIGGLAAKDRSSMRNPPQAPLMKHEIIPTAGCGACGGDGVSMPEEQPPRRPASATPRRPHPPAARRPTAYR